MKWSHDYKRDVLHPNQTQTRISRVLCFFNTFMILNCIKEIKFSSLFQGFFSVGTKQGNDSNVNLYYTIRFPYFISLTLLIFIFIIKSCVRGF
jgi:hypothetical protein